ncbi:MAG TPA: SBBP repeat-containing protein [Flavipsychrobacter sp.]|jgi:hypothetical protein|nr:SBBP repeat-containing protein [Flavipsychrobacter sp.]
MKTLTALFLCLWSLGCAAQTNKWLWAQTGGGLLNDFLGSGNYSGNSLSIDINGNSYITGFFQADSIAFGNITLNNVDSTNTDGFLVKYGPTGAVLWAQSMGGSDVSCRSVATDKFGNVYVTGSYTTSSVIIGNTTLPFVGNPGHNLFVAKFDASGNVLWATSANGDMSGNAIVLDTSDNVYVCASFNDTVTLGSTVLVGTGAFDNYIARLNSATGAFIWAHSLTGTTTDLTTDGAGNPVITGSFIGSSMSFESTVLTGNNSSSASYRDVFTAKYNASGALLWAVAAGGSGSELPKAVITDTAGNIFVGGVYQDSFSFAGTSFSLANTGANYAGGFVIKYNSAGVPQWGVPITSTNYEQVTDLFIDKDNLLLVAGNFSSPTLTLGSVTLTKSAAQRDAFIARYDNTGNLVWADKTDGQADDCQIAADTSGNIYLAGNFFLNVNFGIIPISGSLASLYDIFVAKYGPCSATLAQPSAISGSATVCSGASYTYSVPGVANAGLYIWTLPGGWSGSSTSNTITVTAGNIGGTISIAAASNCDTSLLQTLSVTAIPAPAASILGGTPISFCPGNMVTLSALTGNYSYAWMLNNNLVSGATSSTYATSQPGNYQLIVDNGSCKDTSSITVLTVLPAPNPVITQTGLTLSTAINQGSYQWYKNYVLIPGATANTYQVTQIGDYYVQITNTNNCYANSDTVSIISINVSDIEYNRLGIFPQPAKGYLTIETAFILHQPVIEITDIQGRSVAFEVVTMESQRIRLRIKNVAPGVYFLSLKSGNSVTHERILLE